MNKFELFCMVFYVLDAYWDDTKDVVVGDYLSSANPFLFTDVDSAVPSVFVDFSKVINEIITIDNSFSLANKYINSLNNEKLAIAFHSINEDDWIRSVVDFLSQEHKGGM